MLPKAALAIAVSVLALSGCGSEPVQPIVPMTPSPSQAPDEPGPALAIDKYPYNSVQLLNLGSIEGNLPTPRQVMAVTSLKGVGPAGPGSQSAGKGFDEAWWTYGSTMGNEQFVAQVGLAAGSWDALSESLATTWGLPVTVQRGKAVFASDRAGALVVTDDNGIAVTAACLKAAPPAPDTESAPAASPEPSANVASGGALGTTSSPGTAKETAEVPAADPGRVISPAESCALKLSGLAVKVFDPAGTERPVEKAPGAKGKPKKS